MHSLIYFREEPSGSTQFGYILMCPCLSRSLWDDESDRSVSHYLDLKKVLRSMEITLFLNQNRGHKSCLDMVLLILQHY